MWLASVPIINAKLNKLCARETHEKREKFFCVFSVFSGPAVKSDEGDLLQLEK